MKRSMASMMYRLTGLAGLVCAAPAYASGDVLMAEDTKPTVSVGVYAQHAGDKIVYHYRVSNNSSQNINAVTIGRDGQNDSNPNNDVNELSELPSGWNAKLGIPSTSANTPTGWRVSVIAPEQSAAHALVWEPLNERSPKLPAGQTTGKLSIALDRADNHYLSGHAMITFSDGDPINLTVPLDRLDTAPPAFTVILKPDQVAAQNNKLVGINASFIIKGDYDRFPSIKLESITANEFVDVGDIRDANFGLDDRYFKVLAEDKSRTGRVYTVTYSATDASGNQSLASATVSVSASTVPPVVTDQNTLPKP